MAETKPKGFIMAAHLTMNDYVKGSRRYFDNETGRYLPADTATHTHTHTERDS